MELFIVAAAPLLLIGPIVFIGAWILAPIDRAAKAHRGPRQITVGDILCLFIVIQLPLAAVNFTRGAETEDYFWILTVLTFAVAPLIWINCARRLSQAGISEAKYRLPFMAIILPLAYYGLLVMVGMPVVAVVSRLNRQPLGLFTWLGLLLVWLAVAAALVLAGFYARWLIRRARLTPTVRPEEPFGADVDN